MYNSGKQQLNKTTMIKLRIGNDVRLKWAVFKEDGTPEDFSDAIDIKVEARTGIARYPQAVEVEGNVLRFQFAAAEQVHRGVYDLFLSYTKPDNTIEGGIATYTMDSCRAFELTRKSCELVNDKTDEIILEGIVAGLSFDMLSQAEQKIITDSIYDGLKGDFQDRILYFILEDEDFVYLGVGEDFIVSETHEGVSYIEIIFNV